MPPDSAVCIPSQVHAAAPPVSPVLIPSQVLFNRSRVNLKQQRLSRYFRSEDNHPTQFTTLPTQSPSVCFSFPWGDPHVSGDTVDSTGIFRLYSQNVNGLSSSHGNLDALTFAQSMADKSVAVAGLQETNRNFERPAVAKSFLDCMRSVCTHHQGSVSSAKLQVQSNYQPGGTAVSVRNKWATPFLSKGSDSDRKSVV